MPLGDLRCRIAAGLSVEVAIAEAEGGEGVRERGGSIGGQDALGTFGGRGVALYKRSLRNLLCRVCGYRFPLYLRSLLFCRHLALSLLLRWDR